jgi:hypothetical protein
MTSITATQPAGVDAGGRWALALVAVPTIGAAAMFVVGALVQAWVAGEHGQFHALFASTFLVPALMLAIRRPRGGPASTPAIIGLTVAAMSQLLEGIGGFGYGPGNESRVNALAQLHDLGVMLTPVGLVAGALGLTLAVAQLLRPRLGRWPAVILATAVMAGLGLLIAKMIGL